MELIELIKGIVVAVVILVFAVYGGTRIREVLSDFIRKFGVEEESSNTVGIFAQYIIWVIGVAYFLRALPVTGIQEISFFITSALYHVLLGCLVAGIFLLGLKIKGGARNE